MDADWERNAACRPHLTDLFFDDDRRAEAVAVCEGCPVQKECIWANLREQWGVWGCSREAREQMRRGRLDPDECLVYARRVNRMVLGDTSERDARPKIGDRPPEWVREVREWFAGPPRRTMAGVAVRFDVSRDMARRIVTGAVRADAGGPIAPDPTTLADRERWRVERDAVIALAEQGLPAAQIAATAEIPVKRVRKVLERNF